MLWVTFGCAEAARRPLMVGANMKDENCLTECGGWAAACALPADRPASSRRKIARPGWSRPGGLLLGAGKSTLAQLPERHPAAHGLAIGLARILHGQRPRLPLDLVFDRYLIALHRAGHLRLAQLTFVTSGQRFALLHQNECR